MADIKAGSKVIFADKNGEIRVGIVKNFTTPTVALVAETRRDRPASARNWRVSVSELTLYTIDTVGNAHIQGGSLDVNK